ncbi:olfactory receptor 5V1-like [Ambystoma mexicanum]|uniref:olfactory receptor 5V1-like n=1 Tax=Ambystoma mexicanum TaxID=8296 RepID=UPI0037E87E59
MAITNQTHDTDFIIVGFSELPQLKSLLFGTFLLIYLGTLVGNLLIILVVFWNTSLHTPMYFFLSNLSLVDVTSTFVTFPKMLISLIREGSPISLVECILQLYCVLCMLATEFNLLTVMGYDRYIAICNPLRYTVIMSKSTCTKLAVSSWICGLLEPILHTVLLSGLSFCKSHHINHFFCDMTALLKLSCTKTNTIETVTYILGTFLVMGTFLLIVTSYVKILAAILKINSTEGRRKAFSTCASHLSVVVLFYAAILVMYMRPSTMYSQNQDKILSLLYIVITPLFNPIIYSMKNAEFKKALQRARFADRSNHK